jgi:hypothetical protein
MRDLPTSVHLHVFLAIFEHCVRVARCNNTYLGKATEYTGILSILLPNVNEGVDQLSCGCWMMPHAVLLPLQFSVLVTPGQQHPMQNNRTRSRTMAG